MAFKFWSGWTCALKAVPVIYALHLVPVALEPNDQPTRKRSTVSSLDTPKTFIRQTKFGFRGPQKFHRDPLGDLQEFEEIELNGRSLFTRELFEKVVKLQESAGLPKDSLLFWIRNYFMVVKDGIAGSPIDNVPGVQIRAPSNHGRSDPIRAEQLQEEVQQLYIIIGRYLTFSA
jgi:hypothetical protein